MARWRHLQVGPGPLEHLEHLELPGRSRQKHEGRRMNFSRCANVTPHRISNSKSLSQKEKGSGLKTEALRRDGQMRGPRLEGERREEGLVMAGEEQLLCFHFSVRDSCKPESKLSNRLPIRSLTLSPASPLGPASPG